jgi:uncharacterized protein (TIGR03066 family)
VGVVSADDKVEKLDAKKLVGKWQETRKDKDIVELKMDGTIRMLTPGKKEGVYATIEGKYTVDGNKIKIKLKLGELDIPDTLTVTKLTDTDLVFTSEENKDPRTYTRLKDK